MCILVKWKVVHFTRTAVRSVYAAHFKYTERRYIFHKIEILWPIFYAITRYTGQQIIYSLSFWWPVCLVFATLRVTAEFGPNKDFSLTAAGGNGNWVCFRSWSCCDWGGRPTWGRGAPPNERCIKLGPRFMKREVGGKCWDDLIILGGVAIDGGPKPAACVPKLVRINRFRSCATLISANIIVCYRNVYHVHSNANF